MNKILVSVILVLAGLAHSATVPSACDAALFQDFQPWGFGSFRYDSAYFEELYSGNLNHGSHKYHWGNDGVLDSMVMDPMEAGEALRAIYISPLADGFSESYDGNLSGYTHLSRSGDTTIIHGISVNSSGDTIASTWTYLTNSWYQSIDVSYSDSPPDLDTLIYWRSGDTVYANEWGSLYSCHAPNGDTTLCNCEDENDTPTQSYQTTATASGFLLTHLRPHDSMNYYNRWYWFTAVDGSSSPVLHRPALARSPSSGTLYQANGRPAVTSPNPRMLFSH